MSLFTFDDSNMDINKDQVEDFHLQRRANSSSSMPLIESSVILQNIERIIQENRQLKEDNEAKVLKIHALNDIICDLLQKNQSDRLPEESTRFLGQNNELLESAGDQSQEKISNLEQEKVEDFHLQRRANSSSSMPLIESSVILQNIERIIQENRQLKEDNEAKVLKIHALNDIICDLLQKNQSDRLPEESTRFLGQNNELLESAGDQSQEKISNLEQEKSVSTVQLAEVKKSVEKELDELTLTKDKCVAEIKGMIKKFDVFQEKTRAFKEAYENRIGELMNEIKHLKTSTTAASSPVFSVEIKRVMNRLYELLQGKFISDASYTGSEVLETVLQNIMAITFQNLERKKQSSGDHGNISESSEKVMPKTNGPQSEFSQQMGLNESKVERVPVSNESNTEPVLPDVESYINDSNSVNEAKEERAESQTTLDTEIKKESDFAVHKVVAEEPSNELKVDVNESITRESPKISPSKKPAKPRSAFILFFKEKKVYVKEKYPEMNSVEATQLISRMWNQATYRTKEPYFLEASRQREVYYRRLGYDYKSPQLDPTVFLFKKQKKKKS